MKNNVGETILELLAARKIEAEQRGKTQGPRAETHTFSLPLGVSVRRVKALEPDIAAALGVERVTVTVPAGAGCFGVEVPSFTRTVRLSDVPANGELVVPLGLDTAGNPVACDIRSLPHVIVAGSTGSGKSTLLESWLCALAKMEPERVKLLLVDLKRVELSRWRKLPHLALPVAVEGADALRALRALLLEVHSRYKLMQSAGDDDIRAYNRGRTSGRLPYVVLVVDELADLVFTCEGAAELLGRIMQLGRACGVHCVLATQRPDSAVVGGMLKANAPARIAFTVATHVDARVVGVPGAEKLLGRGDMLYKAAGEPVRRVQGCLPTESDLEAALAAHEGVEAEYWQLPVPTPRVRAVLPEYVPPVMVMPPVYQRVSDARRGAALFLWCWLAFLVVYVVGIPLRWW